MKPNIKKTIQTIALSLTALLIVSTSVYAIGTLTPTGTAGGDTQYSLNDIYTKLTTGATTTEDTGSMTVPGTVSASFRTLTEIYEAVPDWLTLSNSTTTIEAGYYETGDLAAIDADLTAANIADGVEVFGVTGNLSAGVSYPTEWSADNPSGYVDWPTAVAYCDSLEENSHTDWRLPTYIELVNAYLTSNPGNSLGFQSDYYWSSTERPVSVDNAYYVYMYYGDAYYDAKTNPSSYARCTR